MLRSLLVAVGASLLSGCEGPATPASIEGEPVCAPYEASGAKMRGGLKRPVRLRVLDGDKSVATQVLFGRTSDKAPPQRFLLPDADEEYTLEWAQCANERAPASIETDPKNAGADRSTKYECGDAQVYASVKHTTKRGDAATHALAMSAPPSIECWSSPK
jgi:hypothetical protein